MPAPLPERMTPGRSSHEGIDQDGRAGAGPSTPIPYRIRVGAVGHRRLEDWPALAAQVRVALETIVCWAPSSTMTSLRFSVVTALAEGADQLVAAEVLTQSDATLEVVLPLPADQFTERWESQESVRQFHALLGRAELVTVMPRVKTPEAGYVQANDYVVARSEGVIALWDGQPARGPGGTAEVVAMARARGLPLIWIETAPPYSIHMERGGGIAAPTFPELDRFNRERCDRPEEAARTTAWREQLCSAAARVGLDHEVVRRYSDWIAPYYLHADALAVAYQRRFQRYGTAFYVLAALAAVTIPIQVWLFPTHALLQLIEIAFIAFTWIVGHRGRDRHRLHQSWIRYRRLAERLRISLFLALLGIRRGYEQSVTSLALPVDDWTGRAFAEIWRARPRGDLTSTPIDVLTTLLAEAWVDDQITYFRRRSQWQQKRAQLFGRLAQTSWLLGIISVILSAFGLLTTHDAWTAWFKVLDIALPTLATALNGIASQRGYERNAARFSQVAALLTVAKARVANAPDLSALQTVAVQIEGILLEENQEWFAIMEGRDLAVHA